MEYQVPQFLEQEAKIFGPFTFKQFIYLAGGIGICVIAFLYLPFIWFLIFAFPVGAFTGALAFYRINNKPFVEIMEAQFSYLLGGKLYVWRREAKVPDAPVAPVAEETRQKLGLTSSKIRDLAWSLDIKDQGQVGETAPAVPKTWQPPA